VQTSCDWSTDRGHAFLSDIFIPQFACGSHALGEILCKILYTYFTFIAICMILIV